MLSEKAIEEFRDLHKKHFGIEISREDAYEQGYKLVRLFEIIYKPLPIRESKELEDIQEKIL